MKEAESTQGNESLHNIHISLGETKQISWDRASSAHDSWAATVLCKNTGQSFSKWIYDSLDIAIGEHQQQQLVKWEHEEEYHSKIKKTDLYKQIRKRKREE